MLKASHLHTRAIDSFTEYPGLTEQLLAVQGLASDTWSPPSIKEALGVPAVFRAVSLIANTIGMLSMQAFRNGMLMQVTPQLVQRPGVFTEPDEFWRDTGYSMATRGEFLWWVADRDSDGLASKLLLLPPKEVTVEWDDRMPLLRKYRWRDKPIAASDIVHRVYLREPGGLRGYGPLQVCGAALSAAVEADEWAARFFARGGSPSTVIRVPGKLTPTEAEKMKSDWLKVAGNEVRVIDSNGDPQPFQINPENAQLLQSRQFSAGAVATMFGINAHLLNHAQAGSSLTYQNIGEVFTDFVRSSLSPNYLSPIENAMSALLTRSTVARFNTGELYRADLRTRADVYNTLKQAGMEDTQARIESGIDISAEVQPVAAPLEPISREAVPSA